MTGTQLTLEQKRCFYRDGFVVLKHAVPRELTFEARRLINMKAGRRGGIAKHYAEIGRSDALTNLVNETAVAEVLRNTMGPFDAPKRGFAALLYPRDASQRIGVHGLREHEVPNYGFNPHIDGLWTGPIPQSKSEVDSWQAPGTHHFGDASASVIGTNFTPLFQDPDRTLAIGSFTAFVGVALNDQSEFGRGNLAFVKGGHHEVERFFRMQRSEGGPIGPGGPGWPRLVPVGEDGVGLNYFPDAIRSRFTEGAEYTPDGTLWPQPTPVLLEEGDAVIALHAVPHSSTRNAAADPRMNIYFRIRRHRPGGAVVAGDSDHPDRGWNGEFLTYEPGYDPWKVAIAALCDHWREWDGMAEVAAEGSDST